MVYDIKIVGQGLFEWISKECNDGDLLQVIKTSNSDGRAIFLHNRTINQTYIMDKPSGPSVSDEIELSIKYSDETKDLGNEIWCSPKAAKLIARILTDRTELESRCTAQQQRIERLEAVIKAVRALDHEDWCDPLHNISEMCNCNLSDVTLALKELNSEQA